MRDLAFSTSVIISDNGTIDERAKLLQQPPSGRHTKYCSNEPTYFCLRGVAALRLPEDGNASAPEAVSRSRAAWLRPSPVYLVTSSPL